MKSILNTLDIFLGHLAAGVMAFLLYVSFGAVAMLFLISIPIDFFEYGLGMSELDLTEIGIFTCLCIVIWRFYRRGSQLYWTKWQMLRRFVFTVSSMALFLSFIALSAIWVEVSEKGRLDVEFFTTVDKFDTYVFSLLIILVIYAAAPLPKLWQKKVTADTSNEASVNQSVNVVEADSPMPASESQTFAKRQAEATSTSPPLTETQTDLTSSLAEGKL
ncbi:hypothetical protein ACRN9Z_21325 [Shewanella frigidimarina]|uniref:hypothetical protein n=1 Tax=Shewanella frigidimarina TaxID=56812 RepID=UPI003D78E523